MSLLDWVKDAPGIGKAFWDGLTGNSGRPSLPSKKTGGDLLGKLKSELLEIESRSDLTQDEKVRQVTHISCASCAGIAIQPIPFADIFILTPVQIYMGSRIAAIRGVPVSESEAETVLKEIVAALGLGFVAQQTAIGIWKFLVPGLGGFATIPIVYGLTYAIMRVMDYYFIAKAANRTLSAAEIKDLWQRAKTEGQERGREFEQSSSPLKSPGTVGKPEMSLLQLVIELDSIPQNEDCKKAVEKLLQGPFSFPSHLKLKDYALSAYGSHAKWPHNLAYCYELLANRAGSNNR